MLNKEMHKERGKIGNNWISFFHNKKGSFIIVAKIVKKEIQF